MERTISRGFTYHQYQRARLDDAFPDTDEETLAYTLEGLSRALEMFADGGDLWSWHGDYLAFDPNQPPRKFMQCSSGLSSLYS
jgi:hypothetical protein